MSQILVQTVEHVQPWQVHTVVYVWKAFGELIAKVRFTTILLKKMKLTPLSSSNFQCWLTDKIFTDSIDRHFFYLKEWLVNWVVLSLTDRSMITIDWLIDSLYWRLVTHLINDKFLPTLVSYFPNWLLTQHWPYNRTRQMPLASMSKWRNLHPRDHWNVQMSMSRRIQGI